MPKPWRLELNHPPTAVGGIRESCVCGVGWTLTIPQLPLGGFLAQCQIGQSRAQIIRDNQSHLCKSAVPSVPILFCFNLVENYEILSGCDLRLSGFVGQRGVDEVIEQFAK